MKAIGQALARLALTYPEILIVFPLHPNPAIRKTMGGLGRFSNIVLREPLPYDQFLSCLKRAWLVLSDSGGVQEEATGLGKPVLVMRDETERPEGVKAGALKLVGASPKRIVEETGRLWRDPQACRRMCRASHVFGDGRAAQRIVRILKRELL